MTLLPSILRWMGLGVPLMQQTLTCSAEVVPKNMMLSLYAVDRLIHVTHDSIPPLNVNLSTSLRPYSNSVRRYQNKNFQKLFGCLSRKTYLCMQKVKKKLIHDI